MTKAIDAILIKLPKINSEWIESVKDDFYNAGWEEFQKSYPETYDLLDEPQKENLPPFYEVEIHSRIPGYIKETFEEPVLKMWGVELTSIEDIETYNKLVQEVCSLLAELIDRFVSDFLGDGSIKKAIEDSENYLKEDALPNIYEEEWDAL